MEDEIRTRRKAIGNLAWGSIILVWGILLLLKEIGIIAKNVSTLPFPFAAVGALLVLSGIIKLSRSRHL